MPDGDIRVKLPQKLLGLLEPHRYKVLYGGRGGLKSWTIARTLLTLGASKPMRVLCARETQRSISESVHQLLKDQILLLGLDGFYTVQEGSIFAVNGTTFSFVGLRQQTVGNLKSFEGIDIVWAEEANNISKRSWGVLIPTIRKEGSEIWISFNPELDSDETYTRFVVSPPEDALVIHTTYRDNPWFPEVLEKERAAHKLRDPITYDNVWEGLCLAAVEGAVYANEIAAMQVAGRFRNVPYDPMLRVHTVWDLGWNDQASIIMAQRLGSELRIIDYIEDSHQALPFYVAQLRDRPWQWGRDYIPHDGAAHNMATGLSVEDVLRKLGRNPFVMPATDVEDGIKAARLIFPRVYFDRDKAAPLVGHLKRYRRTVNATTGEPGAPLHDEHSHGADAFRKLAEVADKLVNDAPAISSLPKIRYQNAGIV